MLVRNRPYTIGQTSFGEAPSIVALRLPGFAGEHRLSDDVPVVVRPSRFVMLNAEAPEHDAEAHPALHRGHGERPAVAIDASEDDLYELYDPQEGLDAHLGKVCPRNPWLRARRGGARFPSSYPRASRVRRAMASGVVPPLVAPPWAHGSSSFSGNPRRAPSSTTGTR